MTDLSTIRRWRPAEFAALAGDLQERADSSQLAHDGLVEIAKLLEPISAVSVDAIKQRLKTGADGLQQEATVVSLVQQMVSNMADGAAELTRNLDDLERAVSYIRGKLNDSDGTVKLPPDATVDETSRAKTLQGDAQFRIRKAGELDSKAANIFHTAASTDISLGDAGSESSDTPLSVDLDALRDAAKRVSRLEDRANGEQLRYDLQIRGRAQIWAGMASQQPFIEFGDWLRKRSKARSKLLTGLVGSLYQTSSLLGEQDRQNAHRLTGVLGDLGSAERLS